MAQRDYYWDCLKFVLILLVVYGHVLNATTLPDDFSSGMARFIYLFHMPLFIFISGRFSHIGDRNKYKHGIWRLLETYILFMLLTTFLKFGLIPFISFATHRASSISINWEEAIDYFIATPSYLWYLLTLVYYRLMVYFMPEGFVIYKKRVLVISFIISLASGFVPVGYTLSIQRTLALLPFFVMGYYSVDFDVKERIGRVPIAIAWGG